MNPAEMIVALAIVVVVLILGLRRLGGNDRPATTPDDDDTRRLVQDVRQLKERVQVLERVITDNRSTADLDREIDALRDR